MAGSAISEYLQPKLLAAVLGGGAAQSQWTGVATVYIGVSTAAYPDTDANLLAAEPSATGSYGRIVVTNNQTNFPAPTGSDPTTTHLHVSFSFAASTAAWSSGATALKSWFIADASTLGAGNVLFKGALSPATDVVNGSGITFTFAIDALTFTLT
jgi:hypothetical protein